MKKYFGIISCVLFLFPATAQQNRNDSLRMELSAAVEDTNKVKLLNQLSGNFAEINPDSTLFYGNMALELSKRINYDAGEIAALLNTGAGFSMKGNHAKALQNALEGLKKSEKTNNDRLLAHSYFMIAVIYDVQEDHRMAIPYGLKALDIYKKLLDTFNVTGSLINLGVSYNELNQLDSARYFFDQSLELSIRSKKEENVSAADLNLGIVSLKMKQYEPGLRYCRSALPFYKAQNSPLFLSSIYYYMAALSDSVGRRDSAFYYSRLSYFHASQMGSPLLLLYSTKQLSSLFKATNRLDSAFIYHEMAMNAKDSLTSQEKQKQMQALTFNEQLRQMEIQKRKEEAAAARKRNLELAGIAIFIPVFLFIVLLLGRRKVKSRTVEFLGVLALLFLFEFTVLFAHPYIGHWTHESPVWMLLILVMIAAILVPLHQKSEEWIKKRLTAKPETQLQTDSL